MEPTQQETEGAPLTAAVSIPLIAELIKGFVRDLSFYRDALYYPPEHPRRVERIKSLHQTIVAFERQYRNTLYLQVREATIFSEDRPVDRKNRQVTELSNLLRERMIQLVVIRPGLTADEVHRFADFLLSSEFSLDGPREFSLGPNLQLYRFKSDFVEGEDLVTVDEILSQPEEINAEKEVEHMVRRLLHVLKVRNQLDTLFGLGEDQNLQLQFMYRLVELLRCDPRLDWKDFDHIREMVESSLDFIQKAQKTELEYDYSFLSLLSGEGLQGIDLGEALRWQLLRRFVPGNLLPSELRKEPDLASYARVKEGAPPSAEPADPAALDWKSTDLTKIKNMFDRYCEKQQYLIEFLLIVVELVHEDVSLERQIRKTFFSQIIYALQEAQSARSLVDFFDDAAAEPALTRGTMLRPEVVEKSKAVLSANPDTVRRLMEIMNELPASCRTHWQTQLLHVLVPPRDLPEVIAGGQNLILDTLINVAPIPLTEHRSTAETEVANPRELLRQILSLTDDYAMDVVYFLLTGDRREQAEKAQWSVVLKEITSMHSTLHEWIDARVDHLFRRGAESIVETLPLQPLTMGLRDCFQKMPEEKQLELINKLAQVETRHVTRLLTIALASKSKKVQSQALETIGTRFGHASLVVLEAILARHNDEIEDLEEVQQVCSLMAWFQGAAGRERLQGFLRERNGILHKWSRAIRKEVRSALTAWKSEQNMRL